VPRVTKVTKVTRVLGVNFRHSRLKAL